MSEPFYHTQWVVVTKGRHRGRIGLTNRSKINTWEVQFGSGGPFYWIVERFLRHATKEEIAVQEGCA